MAIDIVFETHSISEDNEAGFASGWNHGRLSERGRLLAAELGDRRRDDGLAVVFSSDLRRAAETAEIAFAAGSVPILLDWRLRATTERATERRRKRTSAIVHRSSTSPIPVARVGAQRPRAWPVSSLTSRPDGREPAS